MVQIGLIGIGAGAAAALLFASVASSSPLSVLLFYLAPLPILIAAIGWSHWAGLVAAALAALSLAAVFGAKFFVAFLLSVGAPGWWLGYLALLARPGATPGALEWYPVGHLVAWAAALGSLAVLSVILYFGFDEERFTAALHAGFERVIRSQIGAPEDGPLVIRGIGDPKRFIDFLVMIIPPAAAALAMLTHAFNLWLAASIVRLSGRLRRPWPDLAAMRLPRLAPAAVVAALVGGFFPGMIGIVANVVAASLVVAYAVLGLAVLHMITRGLASRGLVLAATYAALIIFGWPILAMVLIGLIDAAIDLRARIARRRPPVPRQ